MSVRHLANDGGEMVDPNEIAILADPRVQEVFVDTVVGFEVYSDVVRLTLASLRPVQPVFPSPLQHVVVGRIAMSIPAAQNLLLTLRTFLESHSLDTPSPVLGATALN